MTTLYSLRTDPLGYRITKFVDGEPEGSYITNERDCECPAGPRPTCRHRQMLPVMLAHHIANTHWFMDWDRSGSIVDFQGASKRLYDDLQRLLPDELAVSAREPDEIRGPNDIHCSHDLAIDLMAKDITPVVDEAQHVEEDTSIPIPLKPTDAPTVRYEAKHPLPPTSWRRL